MSDLQMTGHKISKNITVPGLGGARPPQIFWGPSKNI